VQPPEGRPGPSQRDWLLRSVVAGPEPLHVGEHEAAALPAMTWNHRAWAAASGALANGAGVPALEVPFRDAPNIRVKCQSARRAGSADRDLAVPDALSTQSGAAGRGVGHGSYWSRKLIGLSVNICVWTVF
jgi:hypothetical protein